MKEELTKTISGIVAIVIIPAIFMLFILAGYAFFGFCAWLSADPFDWFDDGPNWITKPIKTEGEEKWDDCVYSTRTIIDNINDTVGATYALEDEPSAKMKEFMEFCLEKNN